MVQFLQATPRYGALLVEKTDRLYRNIKDWLVFEDLPVDVHFVKEGVILNPESKSAEKLFHGIRVLMAKSYIDNLSEEVKKGMTGKSETGMWPSYAPHGYRNVRGADGKNVIEPDPDSAPVIRRMFERYATGSHSVKEVARMARSEGLRPRRGGTTVSLATVHKVLTNRIYSGDFDWKGKTYRGSYEPLVTRELWQRVQDALAGRRGTRIRKAKHDFSFSGLISCGHCGCALVGDIKKKKYVYYRCSGFKGKCPERYTRQEVFEDRFGDLLKGLRMDIEIAAWVTDALRKSHADEKEFREEATSRLQAEHARLQRRLDSAYEDRLDSRIDVATYDRKAAEWRFEQDRIQRSIDQHRTADRAYVETGVQLLELASRAHELFVKQIPAEKRRLLNFLVSNSTWRDGKLSVTFRQPFDLLMDTNISFKRDVAIVGPKKAKTKNWPARPDSNRRPSA
jgi:site-specific DNA recombinase